MLRQTWDLTLASLKMLLRDRAALISTFSFPVVFLTVFSLYDLSIVPGGGLLGAGEDGLDYFDFVLPGILALGVMQFAVIGVAGSIARYRELKVLRRLVATPVSPSAFITAQSSARLVVALGQVVVLLGYGMLLGGTVVGSPLVLLALAIPGNFIFLAMGFALAGRAPSVDAAYNLAGIATLPLMFMSGMYFPLDALAGPLRAVAELLPITPLVDGMRSVALEGAGLTDLGPQFALLGVWVLVAFVLARIGFRMNDPGRSRRTRRRRRRDDDAAPTADEPVAVAAGR
jgi:ABC-type multidrug transport system permease subunit